MILASGNATADAIAAVIDSLVALILGLLSYASASRTIRRAPARRARRAAEPERETVTLPAGPALADPADVSPLSWPGIYAQVTGLYERLLAYVEQEVTRLRAVVAELENPPEEGPRMPVPRPPGHERRKERRARRVEPGDTFTAEEEVDLVDVPPDPEGAEPAADAEPEIPEDAEEVH